MTHLALQYPIFGPEIQCPYCHEVVPALILTDSYLCNRHGAFEANSTTGELTHLQSGRHWRRWNQAWHRQHTHPDGICSEIDDALDRLYTEGYRATGIIIAQRYQTLISSYLNRVRPYGLPVEFSPSPDDVPRWAVINFEISKEKGKSSSPALLRSL